MPESHEVCAICEREGPVVATATDAGGRALALCRDCAGDPARLRAFVARFGLRDGGTALVIGPDEAAALLAARFGFSPRGDGR